MYCTCIVHVLYMYSTCIVHVLYMYGTVVPINLFISWFVSIVAERVARPPPPPKPAPYKSRFDGAPTGKNLTLHTW